MRDYTVWNQGIARRSLGGGRTHNPTPAAQAMLGKKALTRAAARLKRGGRKRAHKGNPLPAVVGVLGLASKLGGLLGRFQNKDPIRIANAEKAYTDARTPGPGAAAVVAEIINQAHNSATPVGKAAYQKVFDQLVYDKVILPSGQYVGPPMAAPVGPAGPQLAGYAPLVGAVAQQAFRQPRSQRPRYPSYQDRYGRQRYSYKQPGEQFRLPAGATPLPGSPYKFFSGDLGAGGAGTTAAQLGVAAAAGAGAYLVTQKLLQYLGGRAQTAEEAGVNAARAHREALLAHPNEKAAINAAYKNKLIELGYDPVTFTRTRSGFENFVETYNPFGG